MSAKADRKGAYSARRRWLLAAAVVSTAVAFLARPGQDVTSGFDSPMAQFDSIMRTPASAPTPTPIPGSTATFDRLDVAGLSLVGGSPSSIQSAVAIPGQGNSPPARSNVVWSNKTGTITNGGLVAQHCCAGAFSIVVASKSVKSGRHYWEVTLSASPGERHPDSYTAPGVAIATGSSTDYGFYRTRNGAASPNDPNLLWAITRGQRKQFQTGDTFMFAVDGAKRDVFLGVNGTWINGTPGIAGGKAMGNPGDALVPAVKISASSSKPVGDSWFANFGGSKFRYPIPAGYGAYGTYVAASAARSAPSVIAVTSRPSVPPPKPVDTYATGEALVGGRKVPLPEGRWLKLAAFENSTSSAGDEAVVLAKIDGTAVTSLIAIRAGNWDASANPGYPAFSACDRQDVLHADKRQNEANGLQRCWWVNHTADGWRNQPAIVAAVNAATIRGLSVPETMLNVGIRSVDSKGHTLSLHFVDPSHEGISTMVAGWHDSPWHRQNVTRDPSRKAFVMNTIEWGTNWAPVVYAYR